MSLGGGSGGMGQQRVGNKRVSYPQFVRADAQISSGSATGSKADSVSEADIEDSRANSRVSEPVSEYEIVVDESFTEADADISESKVRQIVRESVSEADADIGLNTLFTISTPASSESAVDEVLVNRVSSVSESDMVADGFVVSDVVARQDVDESSMSGTAGITNSVDFSLSEASESSVESRAPVAITSYQAKLGGVVTKDAGGSGVQGAEVHIIRDNDDTKVATTTTDANGEWSVSLPGKDGDDPDPPVYSIQVWYRDGPKRETSATLYNSTNRPFIDTADASESHPSDEFYYSRDS